MELIDKEKLLERIPSEEILARLAVISAPTIHTKLTKYYDSSESVWKIGEVIVDE